MTSERPRRNPAAGPTAALACLLATPAALAQDRTIPTSGTEDAELGSKPVSGAGRVHPWLSVDLRNGDYARGEYDDDASDLRRLPAHLELGLVATLHRDGEGRDDGFLLLESNNGFHSPHASERDAPRPWYESNNLVGLAVRPVAGFTAALTYTNKRSPNGVAGVSHEASLAFAYEGDGVWGRLHPSVAFTARPAAGRGEYVRLGVEPQWAPSAWPKGAHLGLPLHFGAGLGGFYQAGTGGVTYGDAGVAFSWPVRIAGVAASFRAEATALVRDPTLRALDGADANHAAVVPLVTVGLSRAF